jgi:hypothetical protein
MKMCLKCYKIYQSKQIICCGDEFIKEITNIKIENNEMIIKFR